jgi:hypothetical protein
MSVDQATGKRYDVTIKRLFDIHPVCKLCHPAAMCQAKEPYGDEHPGSR